MPISLHVCSASFRLNRHYRENKLWSAHGLSAFSGPDSPVYTSLALRANCISNFRCLPLMLRNMIINLLNKGTICLTPKMKLCFSILWLISHVEWKTAVTEEKLLVKKWAPLACSPSTLRPLFLVFYSFSSTPLWSTCAHLCTAALEHVETDKPAVMKITVPTWSPIEFHYEVYLSGAGCQAPGPVLLSPGLMRWNVTANHSRAALPQPNPCQENWKRLSCSLSLSVGFSVSLQPPLSNYKVYLCLFCLDDPQYMSTFLTSVHQIRGWRFGKRKQMQDSRQVEKKNKKASFNNKAESGQ